MLKCKALSFLTLIFVCVFYVSTSYAQEVTTQPAASTPAPAVSEVTPTAITPVNPMTGAPTGETVDTQSASGTYETLDPAAFANLEAALKGMEVLRKNTVKADDIGSLVFTLWQHSLLQDAKRLFTTRRPTSGEIASANSTAPAPRGIRELSLSGILYKGSNNWIVWLNGQRVAPDAIPKEVIDIKVSESHVDLKWFNSYTNLIYPIRIRPHQRFNLDTRIFLPGITAEAAAQLQSSSTSTP